MDGRIYEGNLTFGVTEYGLGIVAVTGCEGNETLGIGGCAESADRLVMIDVWLDSGGVAVVLQSTCESRGVRSSGFEVLEAGSCGRRSSQVEGKKDRRGQRLETLMVGGVVTVGLQHWYYDPLARITARSLGPGFKVSESCSRGSGLMLIFGSVMIDGLRTTMIMRGLV